MTSGEDPHLKEIEQTSYFLCELQEGNEFLVMFCFC